MTAIITAILALLEQIAPSATVLAIAKIITLLENLIPVVVKETQDLMPVIANVITVLKSNNAVTSEQLQQLQQQEAVLDEALEAALRAAEAEDAAADTPKS